MTYDFKRLQEFGWAVGVAVVLFVAQVAEDFDPETITDWKTWAVSLGGGLIRAVAAATMAFFAGRFTG